MASLADKTFAFEADASRVKSQKTLMALFEKFLYSQRFAQKDPWAERVAGKDSHEFTPMNRIAMREAAE